MGYPYHAYTLLLNAFDNLVLTSAALKKVTDFYSIEGVTLDESFEITVHALTQQLGKKIGAAIIELVNAKFPFNEQSAFSL